MGLRSLLRWLGVGVLAVGVVASVLVSESAASVDHLSITVDTTLSEDHTGTVKFDADNVMLDCAGHHVIGSGEIVGIDLRNRTGVTLKNCEVHGFVTAVEMGPGSGRTVSDNFLHDNTSEGIAVGGSGNTLLRNRSDDNGVFGFLLHTATNNSLTDNSGSGNGGPGFTFDNSSDGNIMSGNDASGNENGFALTSGSSDNTFSDNTASDNLSSGFDADITTSANVFTDNLASGNTDGFHIVGVGSTLTGNESHLNTFGYRDESNGGSGDAGTDNSYSDNSCIGNIIAGSDPLGLCSAGSFTDDDGSIFELDIEWMAAEGITKGCNPPANTLFCPSSFVTRGQMAAFLVRALDLTDQLDDPFIDDDDSIFEADIEKLAAAGITKGCNPPDNDRFCPDSKVTRGQMAAFLVRALGYVDDGGGNLFIDDDGSTFEGDIDRLGTAGVTKGCNPPTNDRYCPNNLVTRGQMAAFLRRALDT